MLQLDTDEQLSDSPSAGARSGLTVQRCPPSVVETSSFLLPLLPTPTHARALGHERGGVISRPGGNASADPAGPTIAREIESVVIVRERTDRGEDGRVHPQRRQSSATRPGLTLASLPEQSQRAFWRTKSHKLAYTTSQLRGTTTRFDQAWNAQRLYDLTMEYAREFRNDPPMLAEAENSLLHPAGWGTILSVVITLLDLVPGGDVVDSGLATVVDDVTSDISVDALAVTGRPAGRYRAGDGAAASARRRDRGPVRRRRIGLSNAQREAVRETPGLFGMYRGQVIDAAVKGTVTKDAFLRGLYITKSGKYGPDFSDPVTGYWWDITTPAQWAAHVAKYGNPFGKGAPLFTTP